MQYVQGRLCIEASSVLDAILIARIPEYGAGYNANNERVNKEEVLASYESRPLSDVLSELHVTIFEPTTSTISGVRTHETKELQIIQGDDIVYLCVNTENPNKFSFFH